MSDLSNLTPEQKDQMALHQVASRAPLTVREGRVVPENPAEELSKLRERPDLQKKMSALFADNARSVTTPLAIEERNFESQKTFFMIDPYEMNVGLPYSSRVSERAKWENITGLIKEAGGSIVAARGADDDGGTRETFTRDRYVVVDGVAYLPDAKAYEKMALTTGASPKAAADVSTDYALEIDQAERFLTSKNIPTQKVNGAWFEGGNIIVDPRSRSIFMGLETDRDNKASLEKLGTAINDRSGGGASPYQMVGVPLTNQSLYYHLDLGMSDPLPLKGEMMISPHLTDPATLDLIKKRIGEDRVMMLGDQEPVGTTNLISPSKNTLVMTVADPERITDLENRGYKVVQDPVMKDLTLGSGGVRCMTNDVPDPVARPSVPSPSM